MLNLATIITLLLVLLACGGAAFKLVRDKAAGRNSCSCGGCRNCPMAGKCHRPR